MRPRTCCTSTGCGALDARLAREGRTALAQACFDFLPHRAALDLAGWDGQDIFAHS
jgi:ribonuclease D